MYEHNALGYWSGLTLCLTKVRSSRARCPATALIVHWHRNSESLRDAKISHRRLQKVELGSQNVKKLKFYHLRYPDSHKDPARQKKKRKKF